VAERLLKYYQYMADQYGYKGKVELAHETFIPSSQAALEPDSPEKLRVFQEAVAKITGKPAPIF
jgi:hypothetical protein